MLRNVRSSVLALAASAVSGSAALAAPVSVDGVIGAEYTGVTPKSVLYSATAPLGNFGTPTNENHTVAYDIYTRSDAEYVYVAVQANPAGVGADGYSAGLTFANLYFDTNYQTSSGSDLGFEVGDGGATAFIPGVPGSAPAPGVVTARNAPAEYVPGPAVGTVREIAIPVEYFTTDALGLSPALSVDSVRLNLSQSLGYSVAGGQSFYGSDRLGIAAVPEPTGLGLLALGGVMLLGRRGRRHAVAGK